MSAHDSRGCPEHPWPSGLPAHGRYRYDEREQVARLVVDAIKGRVPFSTLHRVTRPDGPREVLVVGEGMCDEARLTAVHGHVVDVGVLVTDRANARIDRAVADVVANRATIEQAKGRSRSPTVSTATAPSPCCAGGRAVAP